MKNRLTHKETFLVAIMLFGMFFGAGNLIFPAYLGRQAGSAVWPAIAGLLVTGVGLPLLGATAIGITRSDGLLAPVSYTHRDVYKRQVYSPPVIANAFTGLSGHA